MVERRELRPAAPVHVVVRREPVAGVALLASLWPGTAPKRV